MTQSRNPFKKIFEQKEFLFPYDYSIAEFPFYIDIELTNNCNLNCVMCRRQIMKRSVGCMEENILKRLIDEIADYDCGVRFCRQGEPTLHKDLIKFIDYTKSKGVLIYVSTHGYYSRDRIISIVRARPDVIRFSFQGLNKTEFEKYRVPSKYEVVVNNIIAASEERKKIKSAIPYLIIGTTLTTESEEDIAKFREEWKTTVDSVEIGKTTFSWLEKVERVSKFLKDESFTRKYKPCMEVTTKLSINWNGDICACCSDQDGHFVLGNIKEMSLKEAWNSEKENYLRDMLGKTLRHAELPHCMDCYIENYKFDDFKKEVKSNQV